MTDDLSAGGTGDETAQAGGEGGAAAAQGGAPAAGAEAGKGAQGGDAGQAAGQQSAGAGKGKATIASGADTSVDDKAAKEEEPTKPYWPDDWREKSIEGIADKKEQAKVLAQLKRYIDPAAIVSKNRELEAKLSEGGRIKIPGKDAKPEELAEWQKALGWAEKPEDMIANIKLENGAVLGDVDKPAVMSFLKAVHGATSAQDFNNKATGWYFKQQEEALAAQDQADDTFRRENEKALKDEWGPAFKRNMQTIQSLYRFHPQGKEGVDAWLASRNPVTGRLNGDDANFVRMLAGIAMDVNPLASVVEDGVGDINTAQAKLDSIRKMRTTDSRKYWSQDVQAEELRLIEAIARQKNRAA
jgi:hypothetical protein